MEDIDSIFEDTEDSRFKKINFNKWEEMIAKDKAVRGSKLLDRVLSSSKGKLNSSRDNFVWAKKTVKRLKKLIRLNPKEIYIYDYVDKESMSKDGHPATSIDLHIALPDKFGKLTSRWVTTLDVKSNIKYAQEEAIKSGFEYPLENPEWPEDKFEQIYCDLEAFVTDEDVIKAFIEWRDIFIPELKEAKIIYKKIGKTRMDSILENCSRRVAEWELEKDEIGRSS
jgi:hypothetical protein